MELPPGLSLADLIAAQAARSPGARAVSGAGGELSYRELDEAANRVARWLRSHGVTRESTVGICMDRSPDLLVALVGALRSGGSYVPIDPSYPVERVRFMMADSGARVMLADGHALGRIGAPRDIPVLRLDQDAPLLDELPTSPCPRWSHPDGIAYLIYTSGSTGRPKGVMVTHRGLVNYLHWASREFPMTGERGSLVHSSISFDLTVTGLYLPLLSGADVTLLPDGPDLVERTADELVGGDFSIVRLTPSHLRALRETLRGHGSGETPGKVTARAFVVGGETLPSALVEAWRELAPDTVIYNHYGPSEAVVGRVCWRVGHADPRGGSTPVGRPMHNTRIHVLDEEMRPVPQGETGELFIGGLGLARGYLGRPGLTAGCFVPDPFGPAGERLYRTGDLARWLPEGLLQFTGRVDDQVKVRGHRIELGEVEAALRGLSGVADAAAAVHPRGEGVELVGYVALDGGGEGVGSLRADLRRILPDHLIPAFVVALDRLPLSANGKLDRSALPAPARHDRASGSAGVPGTPEEELVARIWEEVLELPQVGAHDDFFELGGDSILAIRVVGELRRAGFLSAPGDLLRRPVLADLARSLESVSTRRAQDLAVEPREGDEIPLLPAQRWFFDLDLRDPHHYNQAVVLDVADDLDPALLGDALEAVIAAHEAFRYRYRRLPGGRWRQELGAPPRGEGLLTRVPGTKGPRALAGDLHGSLDLEEGPLLRAALTGGTGERRLMLTAHHLVVDVVSWNILLDDLAAACAQLSRGATVRLPDTTASQREWAARLDEYARSDRLAAQAAHWARGHRHQELPVDFPGGANVVSSERAVEVRLPAERTRALLRHQRGGRGPRAHEILVAAVARTIAGWTATSEVTLDLEGHGRPALWPDLDLSRTVGWFTALYPVELSVRAGGVDQGAGPWQEIAEQLRAVPDQGLGYGVLRHLAGRDGPAAPAPQTLVNYAGRLEGAPPAGVRSLGAARYLLGDPDRTFGSLRAEDALRPHLFTVVAGTRGGELVVQWRYSRNTHRESTVRELACRLVEDLSLAATSIRGDGPSDGPRPEDFPLAGLDGRGLARVLRALKK
ncbi:amino acid adenylation domain-containing protein [Streptosporangium sp. NPDC001681]|uniref:amino acid adenylation domain-containing protein n=1 Tax=Streptosporangium sp. NPDC001681 TaxID=3154395 RepID=UPI003329B4FC